MMKYTDKLIATISKETVAILRRDTPFLTFKH